MPRVIAVSSQKGGIGKTTPASNLEVTWAEDRRRVLLVDLDPQFALTRRFGLSPAEAPATAYELIAGHGALADAVVPVGPNLGVLIDCPPNLGLLTVDAIVAADEVLVPVNMTDARARRSRAGGRDAMSGQGRRKLTAIDDPLTATRPQCPADIGPPGHRGPDEPARPGMVRKGSWFRCSAADLTDSVLAGDLRE